MTLVEVLVAGALGALLLLSLSAVAGNGLGAYETGLQEITLSRDSAYGMDGLMRAVRGASQAELPQSRELVLTDPAGTVTRFEWSGAASDPITRKVDDGAALPWITGVQGFSCALIEGTEKAQSLTSVSGQLVYFDYYAGSESWLILEMASGCLAGIEFWVPSNIPLEGIRLDTLGLRLGRNWVSHSGDLRLFLYETRASSVPRPWGSPIAQLDIANGDIPYAEYVSGSWNLYWCTYNLGSGFVIQPNRHYCLMLKGMGPGASCYLRVRRLLDGTEPDNGIRFLTSSDGGVTWYPDLGTPEMNQRDVPIDLTGTSVSLQTVDQDRTTGVEVTMTISRYEKEWTLTRRENLQGSVTQP